MNYNLLISPATFKKLSGSDENITDKRLAPIIFRAQYTYIQDILSTDLYDKILSDYQADTLTGKYSTLYNSYIIPCLVEWVRFLAQNDLSMPLTNKGLMRQSSENSANATIEELSFANNFKTNSAEFWSQRVTNYICEHSNDLPEYSDNNGLDKMKGSSTQYNSGIWFESSGRRRNNKDSRWH